MQSTEQAMEEEKEKLVQELSRGKAAAIALMQVHGFGLSADVSLLWVGLSRAQGCHHHLDAGRWMEFECR